MSDENEELEEDLNEELVEGMAKDLVTMLRVNVRIIFAYGINAILIALGLNIGLMYTQSIKMSAMADLGDLSPWYQYFLMNMLASLVGIIYVTVSHRQTLYGDDADNTTSKNKFLVRISLIAMLCTQFYVLFTIITLSKDFSSVVNRAEYHYYYKDKKGEEQVRIYSKLPKNPKLAKACTKFYPVTGNYSKPPANAYKSTSRLTYGIWGGGWFIDLILAAMFVVYKQDILDKKASNRKEIEDQEEQEEEDENENEEEEEEEETQDVLEEKEYNACVKALSRMSGYSEGVIKAKAESNAESKKHTMIHGREAKKHLEELQKYSKDANFKNGNKITSDSTSANEAAQLLASFSSDWKRFKKGKKGSGTKTEEIPNLYTHPAIAKLLERKTSYTNFYKSRNT